MKITARELKRCQKITKNFKVCSGFHKEAKVFPIKDLTETTMYGQVHYWCTKCYPKIKDDWD